MLNITATPKNREHFTKLMAFAREVLAACDEAGVEPLMDGGLAVFAYTRNPTMEVHDVDLNCPESQFPRLYQGLQRRGIRCEIRSWHVLQARKDGLKVEFGATEHWMRDIPVHQEPVRIAGLEFRVVTLNGLREQYRRGLENTADSAVDRDPVKHRAMKEKIRLLDAWHQA
jgi:hypothetical protein